MNGIFLWLDAHPAVYIIICGLGSVGLLAVALLLPLGNQWRPPPPPRPARPTGLVTKVPARPFDIDLDAPEHRREFDPETSPPGVKVPS